MDEKIYKIRDVVYGFVELDSQEWEIINHPVYQRLRRIKQLSLTDMVYPGATHTRFEHSLGVMQMATDIFDSIIKKPKTRELLASFFHLNEMGIARYRKVIRLAALLHDIGHPPFSHSGEELLPIAKESTGERYSHEEYSIAIIKNMFKPLIETHPLNANLHIRTEEITALLGDKTPDAFDGVLLLFKEIISGQLDADRADYLLRDSIHTGVNYGLYDRSRFVACIDIGITEENSPVLAIQSGGWHIAESLVLARYQMFTQVYFHKTRRIYDHHISLAAKAILDDIFPDSKGTYPSLDNLAAYVAALKKTIQNSQRYKSKDPPPTQPPEQVERNLEIDKRTERRRNGVLRAEITVTDKHANEQQNAKHTDNNLILLHQPVVFAQKLWLRGGVGVIVLDDVGLADEAHPRFLQMLPVEQKGRDRADHEDDSNAAQIFGAKAKHKIRNGIEYRCQNEC